MSDHAAKLSSGETLDAAEMTATAPQAPAGPVEKVSSEVDSSDAVAATEIPAAEPAAPSANLPAALDIPVDGPEHTPGSHTDYKEEALKIVRKGADTLKWGAEEARKGANFLIEKSRNISFQAPNWASVPFTRQKFAPRADFSMTGDAYEIAVELPGLERKDVQVKLIEDQIIVSGEKTNGTGEEGRTYFVQERQSGRFERNFRRPNDADPTKIEARFEHNVLKIRIPKFPEAVLTDREIEVASN